MNKRSFLTLLPALGLAAYLPGCADQRSHSHAVYMLIDTSGTYAQEIGKAQLIVNFLLAMAVLIAITLGTVIGSLAGFFGGTVDGMLMRVTDLFLALPQLPLLPNQKALAVHGMANTATIKAIR